MFALLVLDAIPLNFRFIKFGLFGSLSFSLYIILFLIFHSVCVSNVSLTLFYLLAPKKRVMLCFVEFFFTSFRSPVCFIVNN